MPKLQGPSLAASEVHIAGKRLTERLACLWWPECNVLTINAERLMDAPDHWFRRQEGALIDVSFLADGDTAPTELVGSLGPYIPVQNQPLRSAKLDAPSVNIATLPARWEFTAKSK